MPSNKRLPSPFIVGASRSGTSLLRAMLVAHPDLAIPPETHFIPNAERDCARSEDPRKCVFDTVLQSRNWTLFSLDENALFEGMASLRPFTVADGIRAFFELYASQQGKPRWGDKTPVYAAHMALIERLIPNAHFIHIIRDGRDVSLSALPLMRRQNPDATIEDAARYWVRRVEGTRRQCVHVRSYLEVRYENLVLDTETELLRICEFVKLPWDPILLRYYAPETHESQGSNKIAPSPRPARNDRVRQPPDPSRIHRWRTDMSNEELTRVEVIAGSLLQELDYPLAEQHANIARP
jgi:hypothetical protein